MLYAYVNVNTGVSLELLTGGAAEQCGDYYRQTDMVTKSAHSDITHLGYFQL